MNKLKLYSLGFVCFFSFFGTRNFVLAEKTIDIKNNTSSNASLQKTGSNVKNKIMADVSGKVSSSKNTVSNAVNTTSGNNSFGNVSSSNSSESKSSKKLKIHDENPKKNSNEIKEENYKKQDPSKVKNVSSKSASKANSKKVNLDETENKAIYETPSTWSIESSKKDEEEPQENFAAMQQTSNNQYNDAKWLLYGGIGLAVFSVLGVTFFILFLVKRNKRCNKRKEDYYNEEWD